MSHTTNKRKINKRSWKFSLESRARHVVTEALSDRYQRGEFEKTKSNGEGAVEKGCCYFHVSSWDCYALVIQYPPFFFIPVTVILHRSNNPMKPKVTSKPPQLLAYKTPKKGWPFPKVLRRDSLPVFPSRFRSFYIAGHPIKNWPALSSLLSLGLGL